MADRGHTGFMGEQSEKTGAIESIETSHSAAAAALGFYYQAFFALLTLMSQETDDAAVGIEQLDDVALTADGNNLLYQLKHSSSAAPPAVGVKSKALWKTIKVWVDILPKLELSETTFHLVTVAELAAGSPLLALTDLNADRVELLTAMVEEAQRVIDDRAAAAKAKTPLPHTDRIAGCTAFLGLPEAERLNLLRRMVIKHASPDIGTVEAKVADQLKLLPPAQRLHVAARLTEWWDRQIIYSLCGKRDRVISRAELQHRISEIVADVEQDRLVPDFELATPPGEYQPDGMLARQVSLVAGKPSDLSKAIREEWKARAQRASWLDGNPAMAATIHDYDLVLMEHWSDRHIQMAEECDDEDDDGKCRSGLKILRWTHDDAPRDLRPFAEGWNAPYYVRGSYQVLAIDLKVGWHADYATMLGGGE